MPGRDRAHRDRRHDVEVVLGQHVFARLLRERPALHPLRDVDARRPAAIVGARSMVPTGCDHDPIRLEPRTAHEQGHAQQRVVAERALEDQLVLAEELAVIARHDHQRVVGEPALVEHVEHPPDRVIELGDHPVVARGHARELFAGQRAAARIRPFEGAAAQSLRQDLVQRAACPRTRRRAPPAGPRARPPARSGRSTARADPSGDADR